MLAKSFSQVRTEAEESWEKLLSKIRVIGGTEEEKRHSILLLPLVPMAHSS